MCNTVYADSVQMVHRFDERTLKDLCKDDGQAETNLAGNNRMETALQDASGAIDAACQVGKMYDPCDLAAMDGTNLSLLRRITCELAMMYLIEARPDKYKGSEKALRERTEGYLDRLRKGERVFNITVNTDAGVPSLAGLDRFQYDDQNWIPDRMPGFYPSRVQRLPIGR